MWEIPKIWEDSQCIIIGGGHSIPYEFGVPEEIIQEVYKGKLGPASYSPYMSSIHDQHIIAVNMAYKIGTWMDCVFFGDHGFLDHREGELLGWPGLRITSAPETTTYQGRLKIVERDTVKKIGSSPEPNKICWNMNSGSAAIDLAVHFGAKRIILLGFDMKLDGANNQHWHKYYTSNLQSIQATMKMHLKSFPVLAEDLKGRVEIINASPDSAIDSFPKMAFKDIRL